LIDRKEKSEAIRRGKTPKHRELGQRSGNQNLGSKKRGLSYEIAEKKKTQKKKRGCASRDFVPGGKKSEGKTRIRVGGSRVLV